MRRRIVTIALGLILAGIEAAAPLRAIAQDTVSARITSPKAGDSLFGNVSITGTASNPNMARFILAWDSQDDETETWFQIGGPVTQQVKDGVLGQWNTTTVPDGRYQLRLRVVLRDGTVLNDIVQNLRVSNKQPTPLPTVPPTVTPIQATVPPTAGPSPTPLIQQPPTSTPRPALPTVPPTIAPPPSPEPDSPQVVVAFEALQNACCSGVYLAFFGFAVFGLYRLLHTRLRPVVRRFLRQMRSDR